MKYAVITGSTAGIGLAIAKELINKGYFVFINGRKLYESELPQNSSMFVRADVSSKEGIMHLVQEVLKVTSQIDCLILNAGGTCRKPIKDMTLEEWQYVMDINLNMPFLLVKELLPTISRNGNILFISSAMALRPHALSLPYGVSKAAVNALVQGLVKEVAEYGIRVNSICPGFVDTEWQKNKPTCLREKITSKIALKRFAEVSEIADMCVKVIENTYINGSIISIDGGYDME